MDFPKLRPVEAIPVKISNQEMICLRDPGHWSDRLVAVGPAALSVLRHLDGRNSLVDIQAAFMREFGQLLFREDLEKILQQLDEALLLDNERFRAHRETLISEFRGAPVRAAAHAGVSYDPDPERLRSQLDSFFDSPQGPGALDGSGRAAASPVKGLIAPHIDLRLGGPCFAWAYKELEGLPPADVFVILGTGHQGLEHLFAACEKDFETPLGRVETDREFLRSLQSHLSWDVLEESYAHRFEHAIEFQVLFLKFLYPTAHFRIVPLLCSYSFHFLDNRWVPGGTDRVREFHRALRRTLASCESSVCLIASADLAHVGPRYGDPGPPSEEFLEGVMACDREMLRSVEECRAQGFVDYVKSEGDRRRICGFSPIHTLLELVDSRRGKLLKHDRARMDDTHSTVTFASVAFS
ncbi:MAG: AmmeMemoRadiSam system protein B [Acidobacteria bacterium]|nr:AmmeMemoRadiSam system protein B [Acidobacteriota bacterium]